MSTGGGAKAVVAALLSNLGIAVAKLIAFVITGSSSMLAESIHSLADSGNQVLLLIGGRLSRKPADAEHPFGYGRERYVFAFLVAIVLFTVGGLFAVYEGIEKIRHPHHVESAAVAIGVLAVSMVLESLSLRTAVRESLPSKRPGTSWWRFVRTTRNPELPVVLLEDFAALTGLAFAMTAVVLALATGEPRWDGVGTLAIGVLLMIVAVVLGVEMFDMLVGEAAAPDQVAAITVAISGTPRVTRLIHLRTLHLGPDELLVAAKIAVDPTATLPEVAATIDAAEERLRAAVPLSARVYLEPDLLRGADPTGPADQAAGTGAPAAEPG